MNNINRTWKEAASLIILARDACKNTAFDYKVVSRVLIKRVSQSNLLYLNLF